jgi:gliding motility-associated-like protein
MKKLYALLALIFFGGSIFSQANPSCPTNSIYAHNGTIINGHTLPNGPPTNVLTNLPGGASGLAIGPAFSFPAPNPTWWTTSGGTYWYYNNGGTWSNTGHALSNGAAVNLGGGSGRLYNLVGFTGQIYMYNGTGPDVLLTTLVPAFGGGGPYDVVCDNQNYFYILQANAQQAPQGIYCYNPQGALTCSWSITGMINQTAGGGFAILNTANPLVRTMYYNSNGTDYIGNMIVGSTNIISTVQALPGGGDYACCSLETPSALIVAPLGGTLTCNLPQIPLVAQVLGNGSFNWMGGYNNPTTTPVSPTCGAITWSGPGIISGQGTNTIQVNQPGVYSYTLNGCNSCPGYSMVASFTVIGLGGLLAPTITGPTCFTGPAQLIASPSGTNTVNWSGPGIVGPSNIFTISINQPGTYTAVVSSGTACSGTATFAVNPSPTITAVSNPTLICIGNSAVLTAGGAGIGGTYTWNPGAIPGSTLSVSPLVTSVYSVVGTSTNGCTGTQTVMLTVAPTPTIIATPNPSAICIGNSANVTLSGAAQYSTNPGNLTGSFLILNPTVTTSYSVLGTSISGCTNTTNFQIVVNPLPIVTANSPTICSNIPLNLIANGANTYAWSGPNGFSSTQQNPSIPNAQPNMTGVYQVIGTTVNGCTASAIANVSVIPVPAPNINANTPCVGGTLNLIGSGGATYTWSGPNGFVSVQQTPTINNVTSLNGGIYTLSVSIGFCVSSSTFNAIINALPIPTLTTNAPVCENQTILLNGSGGLTYQWYGPNNYSANGANITFAALQTRVGTYTAVGTDANGCVGNSTIFIGMNANPLVGTKGSTICANTTMTVWAAGGTIYNWTGPNGFTANTGTINIPNADLSMIGVYSVTVTDANGCKGTGVAQVSINPSPTVTADYSGPICAGQSFTFHATAQNAVLYYWHGPLTWMSVLQNPSLNNLAPEASGLYTVFVHDELGCEGTAFVNVLVRSLPNLTINSDKLSGCVPLCVNLSQTSPNTIVSSMYWAGNGNNNVGPTPTFCYDKAGRYLISSQYTDNYGCVNTSTLAVEAYAIPIADFNFSPNKPIINESIEFTDASREAEIANCQWNFSNTGNQLLAGSAINRVFDKEGSYAVALIVTSINGCKDTIVKAVFVGEDYGVYVPDAFSPNGDGINDVFTAKGFGITKFEMNIFDRWGEKLYTTNDIEKGWDGKYAVRGGEEVKQDVYVWKIKLTDTFGKGHEMSGKVSLIK